MKKTISSIFAAVSAIMLFSGCDNAEYKVIGNIVYLSDADGVTKAATYTVENGVDIPVSVRLAQKTDRDVSVSLEFSQADLDAYNGDNGTEYVCLDGLPSDASVTIPAGSISATYVLHVDDYAAEGTTYAVPVRLGEVREGDVMVSAGQGHFIYVHRKYPFIRIRCVTHGKIPACVCLVKEIIFQVVSHFSQIASIYLYIRRYEKIQLAVAACNPHLISGLCQNIALNHCVQILVRIPRICVCCFQDELIVSPVTQPQFSAQSQAVKYCVIESSVRKLRPCF